MECPRMLVEMHGESISQPLTIDRNTKNLAEVADEQEEDEIPMPSICQPHRQAI